jgi:vacuolar protein sorting-associated protein 16
VLGAGNTRLAATFVPKCTNATVEVKIEMYVKCGMIVKAGEEALKAKDMNALEMLRGKATGTQAAEVERMINQLKPRR